MSPMSEVLLIKRSQLPLLGFEKPGNLRQIFLPCPNQKHHGPNQLIELKWECFGCNEEIEYGLSDGCLYCSCGRTRTFECFFTCPSDHEWINDEKALKETLSIIKPYIEFNILLLGETGVGKSTFINSLANYLAYSSVEEAIKGKIITLIPNEFLITDENYRIHKIVSGEKNESENKQQGPTTRKIKVHKFTIRNTILRIIDTPGYVDARNADMKFLRAILCSISSYEFIHAIAVFVKPNCSNVNFVGELLNSLHKSVLANLIFCFTNTRPTKFRTGDKNPALEKVLAKRPVGVEFNSDNIYCFDSECYNFLSAMEKGLRLSKDVTESLIKSWNQSVKETDRLMNHIKSLGPQKIQQISPVNTPLHITKIAKLMAEINERIALNTKSYNHLKSIVNELDEQIRDLAKYLISEKMEVKRVELDHPRTVCTNSSCVEIREREGSILTIYKSCHEQCSCIHRNSIESTDDPQLINCWAMDGEFCWRCKHHFSQHKRITYEIEDKVVKIENELIKKKIERKTFLRKQKAAKLAEVQLLIEEYKIENSEIAKMAEEFCCEVIYDYSFFCNSSTKSSQLMDTIFGTVNDFVLMNR